MLRMKNCYYVGLLSERPHRPPFFPFYISPAVCDIPKISEVIGDRQRAEFWSRLKEHREHSRPTVSPLESLPFCICEGGVMVSDHLLAPHYDWVIPAGACRLLLYLTVKLLQIFLNKCGYGYIKPLVICDVVGVASVTCAKLYIVALFFACLNNKFLCLRIARFALLYTYFCSVRMPVLGPRWTISTIHALAASEQGPSPWVGFPHWEVLTLTHQEAVCVNLKHL